MVRVRDLEASLAFFCGLLDMEEIRRREDGGGKYTNVFLAAPTDTSAAKENNTPLLELTYNWPDEKGETEDYGDGRNFGHLAYEVENIYETCQKLLDNGIAINRPPRDGRMAFIKTPDGISIELLQEGEALPLEEPWSSMTNTGTW